jgi:phage shock protein A
MMDEIAELKATIKRLEKRLEETQESLDKLQKNVIKSCDDAIAILRDNEHYHKLEDYTESRK